MVKIVCIISMLTSIGMTADTELSQAEKDQIESVLKWVYSSENANTKNPMNSTTVKVNDANGETLLDQEKTKALKLGAAPANQNALLRQAQKKATDAYNKSYCESILKKKFPDLKCDSPDGRQSSKAHDNVALLTRTWMTPSYALNDMKPKGTTKLKLWSDDYWRLQWGATSYRYVQGESFETYKDAVGNYKQPADWKMALGQLGQLNETVASWSPAEKYDLTVGDAQFTLTNAQKAVGSRVANEDGDVEPWMGICHGWAAAAIMVPRPERQVIAKGSGVQITWYPHDIRAMASLAWAEGKSGSNFVGGRCNSKDVKAHPNGRLIQDECFDNAPNTFHLALGNLIGKAGLSFVMDKTFDYEVWNQPIYSYEFTYFNPLDRLKRSSDWRKVAVAYDKNFKKADRFQKPLTRGVCSRAGSCDDSEISHMVGVIATVVYLAEVTPIPGDEVNENRLVRETYTYDLELKKDRTKYLATGGEWHYNSHPDFLWLPTKDSVATTVYDGVEIDVDLDSGPSQELTNLARGSRENAGASRHSYPLRRVMDKLVEGSESR